MPSSRSSADPSVDKYDMLVDNTPLSQEEEDALAKIEGDSQPSRESARASPSDSPARKRRRRNRSASPHVTPSKLCSSVKASARALDAGFKPNSSHALRQEPSITIPASEPASTMPLPTDTTRRSESIGPAPPQGYHQQFMPYQTTGQHPPSAMQQQYPPAMQPPPHPQHLSTMQGPQHPHPVMQPPPHPQHPTAMQGQQYPPPAMQPPHPQHPSTMQGQQQQHPLSMMQLPHPQHPSAMQGQQQQHPPSTMQLPHPQHPSAMQGQQQQHLPSTMQLPHPQHPSAMQGQQQQHPPSTMQQQPHPLPVQSPLMPQQPLPSMQQQAPPTMQQYAPYAGPGQPHTHLQPPQYHPGMPYYTAPPYQQPSCSTPEMPSEGPNPSNMFSSNYVPQEPPKSPLDAEVHPPPSAKDISSMSTPPKPVAPKIPPPHAERSSTAQANDPGITQIVPTPSISVEPATPVAPRHESRSHNHESPEDGSEMDRFEGLEDSPTVGRLPNASRKALFDGLKELDALAKSIGKKAGLNAVQVAERWDFTKKRTGHSWNIYQGFFEDHREEEIARLPLAERPPPGVVPNKATISACYDLFKAAKPTMYDKILQAWHRIHIMSDQGDMSVAKRAREFKKHVERIENMLRQSSTMFGFETLFITVGGVVNQDQNLVQIGGTDATFFLDRYCSTDNLALGQMKAHVYDRLSRCMTAEGEASREPSAGITIVKNEAETSSVGEVAATIKELKEKFCQLAEPEGINVMKGAGLCWKQLVHIVAAAGYIFVNWPEDVSFPCDDVGQKGISILKNHARILLYASFDHPIHPLHLEKCFSSVVPVNKLAIIGAPPDANSPHTRGRRKFLDDKLSEDRKGPARLKVEGGHPTASSSVPLEEKEDQSEVLSDTLDDEEEEEHTKKAEAKRKGKVQFVVPDDDDDAMSHDAASYYESEDGRRLYSGSDDNAPLVRSPHNLRSETAKSRKRQKKKGSEKRPAKRSASSLAEEDEDNSDVIEVAAKSVPKPSNFGKKDRAQLTVPKCSSPARADGPSMKHSHPKEHSLTDSVAEKLFGGVHRVTPTSAASGADVHPKPTSHNVTPQPSPTPFNNPPPTSMQPLPPQQQSTENPSIPQPPTPRQESYPATNYPPMYAEAYNRHPPNWNVHPNWNAPPGQGWYPPGPSNPPPSNSNSPMTGPAYSYWPQQAPPFYPNPYGQYPPCNAQTTRPQDDESRGRMQGNASPPT